MATLQELACTEVLQLALGVCCGSSLAALRCCGRCLGEGLPRDSPLWEGLLRRSPAWLSSWPSASTAVMTRALRLSAAEDRCDLRLSRDTAISAVGHCPVKSQRHRVVVTGARRSGISTVVRMLVSGCTSELPAGNPQGQEICVHSFRAELGQAGVIVSVVDKRSTAISTPLSGSLYTGHTAALFVFDAARMEESLAEAAWCIEELRQAVGPDKFAAIPKVLLCHKADLLPGPQGATPRDAPALAEHLPPMCQGLLQSFNMDLVFTARADQAAVDLAFALAAEQWPHAEPERPGGLEMPEGRGVRHTLRRARGGSAQPRGLHEPRHELVQALRLQQAWRSGDLLGELQARVRRVE